MFYMEVSAKTGHSVEEAFYKMAYEVHGTTVRQSLDSVNSKTSKGRSTTGGPEGENGVGVMADRVKLSRPSGHNNQSNQYAAANEVPTGMHDKQKKKCC